MKAIVKRLDEVERRQRAKPKPKRPGHTVSERILARLDVIASRIRAGEPPVPESDLTVHPDTIEAWRVAFSSPSPSESATGVEPEEEERFWAVLRADVMHQQRLAELKGALGESVASMQRSRAEQKMRRT